MCQFSVKTDNFEFFDLNLGKLPNYVQYFGSYDVEGVAESWVELDEAGWSWVEVGAQFSNTHCLLKKFFLIYSFSEQIVAAKGNSP